MRLLVLFHLLLFLLICAGEEKRHASHTSPAIEDGDKSMFGHSPNSFMNIVHKFSHTCGRNNIVKARTDGFMFLNISEKRNWSLKSDAMRNFLGLHTDLAALPFCETVEDVVASSSCSLESEVSAQRPCIIKWLSRDAICHVFSMYRNILILGDSLTRHLASALLMILSEDYRYGGFLLTVPGFNFSNLWEHCTCDGTFSEHALCRKYLRPVQLTHEDILKNHYCASYPDVDHIQTDIYMDDSHNDYSDFDFSSRLCGPETSLRLVMLQGGSHYSFSAEQYIPVLNRTLIRLKQAISSCPYDISKYIRVVFSGVPMVHPAVVGVFGV